MSTLTIVYLVKHATIPDMQFAHVAHVEIVALTVLELERAIHKCRDQVLDGYTFQLVCILDGPAEPVDCGPQSWDQHRVWKHKLS